MSNTTLKKAVFRSGNGNAPFGDMTPSQSEAEYVSYQNVQDNTMGSFPDEKGPIFELSDITIGPQLANVSAAEFQEITMNSVEPNTILSFNVETDMYDVDTFVELLNAKVILIAYLILNILILHILQMSHAKIKLQDTQDEARGDLFIRDYKFVLNPDFIEHIENTKFRMNSHLACLLGLQGIGSCLINADDNEVEFFLSTLTRRYYTMDLISHLSLMKVHAVGPCFHNLTEKLLDIAKIRIGDDIIRRMLTKKINFVNIKLSDVIRFPLNTSSLMRSHIYVTSLLGDRMFFSFLQIEGVVIIYYNNNVRNVYYN